jgi:serine protease inhibitor ecotin
MLKSTKMPSISYQYLIVDQLTAPLGRRLCFSSQKKTIEFVVMDKHNGHFSLFNCVVDESETHCLA